MNGVRTYGLEMCDSRGVELFDFVKQIVFWTTLQRYDTNCKQSFE